MVGGADGVRTFLLVVDAQADVQPIAKTFQNRLLAPRRDTPRAVSRP